MFKAKRLLSISSLIGFYLFTVLMGLSQTMASEPIARLSFVLPFSIETYTPVTTENIGKEFGRTVLFMEENNFISTLPSMLESHPARREILTKGIRLKVELIGSRGLYFVDKEGTVLKADGSTFTLMSKELE